MGRSWHPSPVFERATLVATALLAFAGVLWFVLTDTVFVGLTIRNVDDPIEESLELEPLWDRQVEALSGGELQRVAIGLCLAREADLHLLDEPSALLDVDRRVAVADHLHRLARRRDRPVIVVDHDLFTIGRFADRLIVFDGQPGRRGRAPPRNRSGTG